MKKIKKTILIGLKVIAVAGLVGQSIPVYAHGGRHHRGGGCSPEVKENVVTVTERILHEAASSDEFKNASQFKDFVSETEKMPNTEAKLHAYFSVIGVDSKNADAVAEFLGARNHDIYRRNAEDSMGLTSIQAETLVSRFAREALSAVTQ